MAWNSKKGGNTLYYVGGAVAVAGALLFLTTPGKKVVAWVKGLFTKKTV